jgi:hypothetical protein
MAARSTTGRASSINDNAKPQPSIDAMFAFYLRQTPNLTFRPEKSKNSGLAKIDLIQE